MTKEAQDETRTYKVTLVGEGTSFERDITEAVALEILATIMGDAPPSARSGAIQAEVPRTGAGSGRAQSVREYIDQSEPKRNVDRILAIAGYLEDVRDVDTFSADDVRRGFRDAKEKVPGNYSRDFSWAVKNGWLSPDDDVPGEYYVTETGRTALNSKFSDEVKKATGVARGSSRRRRQSKSGDEA